MVIIAQMVEEQLMTLSESSMLAFPGNFNKMHIVSQKINPKTIV